MTFIRTVRVETGSLVVGSCPDILCTRAVGSCVAIALYDRRRRAGGLAHISLPAKMGEEPEQNLHCYAGIAVDTLLGIMCRSGSRTCHITAKIAGGGNMFGLDLQPKEDVGWLNVCATREALIRNGIPIVAEDVLGNRGRNVDFDLTDGTMKITLHGGREAFL